MEYLDIINEKDEVVGRATMKEIYAKKLMHRITHILIFNSKGEMALQLRSKYKSFCPNYWCTTVGGHVHSSESYERAALREFQEELGIQQPIISKYKDFYNDGRKLKKILVTFEIKYDGPFKLNPWEVQKIEFFTLEQIQKMISKGEKFHPELLFLLKKHFGVK